MDGFMRVKYPETWRQMKKQAIDVMLDHRLNPDDTARISSPEIEDLLHAKARGMSRFNILNIVPEPKNPEVKWVFSAGTSELFTEEFYQSFTGRLRPYLKKLEANGLDGMAYIYGFDEVPQSYFRGMDRMWRRLKEDFPNLPMMTTSKMFRALVRGKTNDFHCVTTDWYCPVSNDYNLKWADYLRAKGKKVWWYTCCSPGHPFANMASLEYPAVEGRLLLGYLTWLYRADGFLFWHVNNWRTGNEPMDETDTYFPEWNTWNYLGIPEDGIFLYPGKEHILPSIRFANIRDGEEDYEYLLRAEKMLGRKAVEDMVRPLVRSQTDFTRDAAALASLRANLAKGTANTGCASFSGSLDKATAGEAGEPKISVFASFIRRVAKERGISKSEAADLLYSIGVRGFDAGPGDGDLDELAATRLKPINFYYFPDWFGRAERPSTLSPEACLARAAKLGVPRIMVVPPNFTDGKENEEEFGRIMECMRDFVAEAKKRSIAVTVEDFGGIRNCCSYAKYLKRFLDEIPDLRFALDSGNLYYAGRGDDILEMMEFAKGRIGHVHLKDQLAANNREYVTLGLGAVPNEKIVKAVAATGYSGWYTLENPVGDVYNDTVRQVALVKAWLSAAKRGKSEK